MEGFFSTQNLHIFRVYVCPVINIPRTRRLHKEAELGKTVDKASDGGETEDF